MLNRLSVFCKVAFSSCHRTITGLDLPMYLLLVQTRVHTACIAKEKWSTTNLLLFHAHARSWHSDRLKQSVMTGWVGTLDYCALLMHKAGLNQWFITIQLNRVLVCSMTSVTVGGKEGALLRLPATNKRLQIQAMT